MEESQISPGFQDDRSQSTAETLRALREQANQKLDEHRRRFSDIESDLAERVELLVQELASDQTLNEGQQQQQHDELHLCQEKLAEQDQQFVEQAAELDEAHSQIETLQQERDQFQEEANALRQQQQHTHTETSQAAQQQGEAISSVEQQCDTLQQKLDTLQAEQATTQQSLEEANAKNEQATHLLSDAEQRILQLSDTSQFDEQQEEMQRKFDLALADVHGLKRENAELHEELVRRPEADEQESSELISLRAERDALAVRIAELENAPMPDSQADTEQEMADLQRRFEMAVEDIRHLKQENETLQTKLTKAQESSEPQLPEGEMDWEAQKARLMRQLAEEEGEPIEEPRLQQRATIEGTITLTDAIVAKKDTEIAQLKSQGNQLRENQENSVPEKGMTEEQLEEMKQTLREELLADEEAVQKECHRLQELQDELQEKMRKAELEMSVERASLAREKVSLDAKRSQLSSKTSEDTPSEGGSKPGRRWLSALGLRDEKTD